MSNTQVHTGISKWNDTFPVIIYFFSIALIIYSVSASGWLGSSGLQYVSFINNENTYHSGIFSGLWILFAIMGAEVYLKTVKVSGPLVLSAIIGGVIIPLVSTYSLFIVVGGLNFLIAFYAAAGSMATDVPMARGSARLGKVTPIMFSALGILAIGDDVIAVTVMAGLYADHISQVIALGIEVLILCILDHVGKKEFKSEVLVWGVICISNTIFLYINQIEPILGG